MDYKYEYAMAEVLASFVSFPVVDIVSGGKHMRMCNVIHSKAKFDVMSGKNKIFAIRHTKSAKWCYKFNLASAVDMLGHVLAYRSWQCGRVILVTLVIRLVFTSSVEVATYFLHRNFSLAEYIYVSLKTIWLYYPTQRTQLTLQLLLPQVCSVSNCHYEYDQWRTGYIL
jgi:hypothetical protein